MTENLPIMVLKDSDRKDGNCRDTVIIGLELEILGEPVSFRIGVARTKLRLADIVPLARTLSTKLALAVLKQLGKEEKFVPCCKGCSACCNYLIPLSVPEAFRMRQEILAMPANRGRSILRACLAAAERIVDDRPGNFDLHSLTEIFSPNQVSQISKWYAGLKLQCPFLSDGLCTIYKQRPIACREHIVTGSALLCEAEGINEPQVVRMPVSILEGLAQLASELEGMSVEAIMLPLALPWTEENLQRDQRTWPAVMMVERFASIVKTIDAENSAAAVR